MIIKTKMLRENETELTYLQRLIYIQTELE